MKWTEQEIEILKNDNIGSLKDLTEMLPGRTLNQVKVKKFRLKLPKKKNFNYWSQSEINILKEYGSNSYTLDLAKLLPGRNLNSIAHKLKRLRIFKTSEFMSIHGKKYIGQPNRIIPYYKKLDQSFSLDDLDNETYQVLIGSLLGDGCVTNQNRNKVYIFKETHGVEQKDYLIWKHKMLNIFQPNNPSCLDTKPIFSTPSHPIFKQLRNEWYNEAIGQKSYIPLKYIEKLDALGLLIWYLDDGCRNKWSPSIASTLFSLDDLQATVNCMNKNLNLATYILVKKRIGYKEICFPAKTRNEIIPIWEKLFDIYNIPDCMRYKIVKQKRK